MQASLFPRKKKQLQTQINLKKPSDLLLTKNNAGFAGTSTKHLKTYSNRPVTAPAALNMCMISVIGSGSKDNTRRNLKDKNLN